MRYVDDNAQLRVFCAYLEGLLANAAATATGNGSNSRVRGGEPAGEPAGARAHVSPFPGISADICPVGGVGSATVTGGAGCGGTNINTTVVGGSDGKHSSPSPPFALRRMSLGERKGSPLSGPFQELC